MKKTAEEVRVSQVKIEDAFWSKIQEKVIDQVIPFQEKVLNDEIPGVAKSHAIENFRIAAGLKAGEFYGMVFQDSDVAKWLEGVAYSLSVKPDAALEERADRIIDIIEKAQQPDGYLDTYFIVKEPEHRWQNLHECHELYCAGHMMEAAAAYAEVTGKDRLLGVTERLADHIIFRFGPEEGKEHGFPGHQEVEIGLMKLYHVTGKGQTAWCDGASGRPYYFPIRPGRGKGTWFSGAPGGGDRPDEALSCHGEREVQGHGQIFPGGERQKSGLFL